jgi:DNA-binding NtrC family response regulator
MDKKKNKTINILHIEDNAADAANILEILFDDRKFSYKVESAVLLTEGLKYLARDHVDIILLDLSLPDSTGYETFLTVKQAVPHLPVIIMTGLADEDLAIKAVQEGAQDYLVKGMVDTDLLVRSIKYAIEREKLAAKLREAFDQIKILKGLLPICAHCKNIRDDQGFWHQVEEYVARHSEAEFTHGICPECAKKFYPDFCRDKEGKKDGKV